MKDKKARVIIEKIANELAMGVEFGSSNDFGVLEPRIWCNHSPDTVNLCRILHIEQKLNLLFEHLGLELHETDYVPSKKVIRKLPDTPVAGGEK